MRRSQTGATPNFPRRIFQSGAYSIVNTSPMKKFQLHFSALVVICAFLVALPRPIAAQDVPSEKAKASMAAGSPGKFEITWTRPPTPELQMARNKLASSEKAYRQGGISQGEITVERFQVAEIERHAPFLLSIVSHGGSLREFISAASASEDVSLTLINAGDPADMETQLPAFNLRNANWGTVIEVLANFLATRGLQLKHAGGDNPNPNEARSVVCVLRRTESSRPEKQPPPAQFKSFQLGEYLSKTLSIDDVVDAIRTAWKMDPTRIDGDLQIKFHPATKLLFVSGPEPAATIASQVIDGLRKKPVVQ